MRIAYKITRKNGVEKDPAVLTQMENADGSATELKKKLTETRESAVRKSTIHKAGELYFTATSAEYITLGGNHYLIGEGILFFEGRQSSFYDGSALFWIDEGELKARVAGDEYDLHPFAWESSRHFPFHGFERIKKGFPNELVDKLDRLLKNGFCQGHAEAWVDQLVKEKIWNGIMDETIWGKESRESGSFLYSFPLREMGGMSAHMRVYEEYSPDDPLAVELWVEDECGNGAYRSVSQDVADTISRIAHAYWEKAEEVRHEAERHANEASRNNLSSLDDDDEFVELNDG